VASVQFGTSEWGVDEVSEDDQKPKRCPASKSFGCASFEISFFSFTLSIMD